jgi:hypothetical protein
MVRSLALYVAFFPNVVLWLPKLPVRIGEMLQEPAGTGYICS